MSLIRGLCDILQHHVRKDSREYRKIHAAIGALDELKSIMDAIVCRDMPDGIGDSCVRVYYGVGKSIGCDHGGELDDVLDNYALRHAMRLLDGEHSGRDMDADEITLTRFDSSHSRVFDEKRDEDKKRFLHVRADTSYVTSGHDGTVGRRPPEDEMSPNQTTYALAPCQIRDLCEDAMRWGKYPSDHDIESLFGKAAHA